jgi:putative ABC transport system substrate-binding protein
MRRRDFIKVIVGSPAAWPLAAGAQQAGKLPTIGFLGNSSSIESQRVAAFVQRLRELGWIDGRNLAIEYRWAEGRNERYAEAAAELVRLKVDIIVTVVTPATLAAKQATTIIPIVFGAATDPIGTGLVQSLARPGGNVTGLSNQISDTSGKKLEFLREIVPSLRRLAILANPGNPAVLLVWSKPRQRGNSRHKGAVLMTDKTRCVARMSGDAARQTRHAPSGLAIAIFPVGFVDLGAPALMQPLWQSDF